MPSFPVVFCAPTLAEARTAAWTFVAAQTGAGLLDPPLVLGRHAGAGAWRDLARAGSPGQGALVLPRLVTPDWYFARAHSANARQRFWGGLNRLWTLAKTLRSIENRLELLDFDADDTEALREMSSLIALLRRQNLSALPVGDDPYGRELEQWRAAYDDELKRLDAFDFEAAPALFLQAARANRAFCWPKFLVADDLGEPSPALEIGLAALFSRATCVVGAMATPGGPNEDIARRARAFWTRHGAQFIEERDHSPRAAVAHMLLDPAKSRADSPAPAPDVWLCKAHTTGDEAGRIAAHIRREVESGARARDFCLLVPDLTAQHRPLRAAFEAAGVPLDWPDGGAARSPLFERLVRLLVPRALRGVDELHDLLGSGALRLEWSGDDGQLRRLDAGRLRRAHRSLRGEDDVAPWRDPLALARGWTEHIARLRASDAGRGDQARAQTLACSLDGGDLEGVALLKELLAPLASPMPAREWETAALALATALAGHWEHAPLFQPNDPPGRESGQDDAHTAISSRPINEAATATEATEANGGAVGSFVWGDENGGQASSRGETSLRARAALEVFRAGVRAVAERAGDEAGARSSGAWAAWLQLEAGAGENEMAREGRGTGVRVLRVGEESEAATGSTRGVFVVGLSERAWPKPRPVSAWPRATTLALAGLREDEAPSLSLALHGFARLLALSCPLYLSRAAWTNGAESGASPLWEDLVALFPTATWPSLERAEDAPVAPTRAHWLRLLARSFQARRTRATDSNSGAPALLGGDAELETRLLALDAMRRGRASLDAIGRYDGVLGERGRELLQPLLAREGEQLVVSPSGVENYARCPIRFFFERVLGLPDEDALEDDLSRAEGGDLVHRVLHAFRRDWHRPLSMNSFEPAREALAHLTRRECDSLGLPPILRRAEARRLLGTPQCPGSLVRLLRAECLEADAGGRGVWAQALHPLLHLAAGRIEGAAGGDWTLAPTGSGLEQAFRLPLRGVVVQGRIDRIDASLDGSLVVVLDYKTGSSSSLPSFSKGSDRLSFQLAVYLLAAGELVRDWDVAPRVAASYLSPRAGFVGWTARSDDLGEGTKGAMKGEAMDQWLADSRVQIERIASLIEAGTFNLSLRPAKIARCDGCACRALCGQNAQRQAARAGIHLGSDAVFLPERIEWNTN